MYCTFSKLPVGKVPVVQLTVGQNINRPFVRRPTLYEESGDNVQLVLRLIGYHYVTCVTTRNTLCQNVGTKLRKTNKILTYFIQFICSVGWDLQIKFIGNFDE